MVMQARARRSGLTPLFRRVSRLIEKLALRRRQDRRVTFVHRTARKIQNRSPNPMPVSPNKHHVALGRQRQHTHPIRVFKHIIRRNIPPRRRPTMVGAQRSQRSFTRYVEFRMVDASCGSDGVSIMASM